MDQNRTQNQTQPNQDFDRPNQNANKEPAEGSRDTVRAQNPGAQNPEQDRNRDERAGQNRGDQGAGITNRPLDREQQEQREVPPRGRTKDETRNA